MPTRTTVYGSWTPGKDESPCNPMEAWPSMRAAERALRDRLAPRPLSISRCTTYYLDRPQRDDAQFYGSKDNSAIFLYDEANADAPTGVLEFGPKGGIRRTAIGQ